MIIWVIPILLGMFLVSEIMNRKERKDLLNRIMAKNYQEYEYYRSKWPMDLKEVKQLREEAREDRVEEKEEIIEEREDPKISKFLSNMEEDWSGQIDKTRIDKITEE